MERHRHDQMTNTVALPLSCICHQSVAVTLHRHFTAYLCLEHVCDITLTSWYYFCQCHLFCHLNMWHDDISVGVCVVHLSMAVA